MASAFFLALPSPQLSERLSASLSRHSQPVGQCVVWTGSLDRYGYGLLRVSWSGKRVKLLAHRLAYFLSGSEFRPLYPGTHVSHLCHNKACVRREHLSYEPASINNARRVCLLNGECAGHRGYYRCNLDAVMKAVDSFRVQFVLLFCVISVFFEFSLFAFVYVLRP